MKPQQQPSNPATAPYDPNRQNDPMNRFRSQGDRSGNWGNLPARARESILSSHREIDDFPAEMREVLKEFYKVISGENK